MSKMSSELPNLTLEDKLRLTMIYLSIFSLQSKSKESIFQMLGMDEYQAILKNLQFFGYNKDLENSAKTTRFVPELTKA